jgi:hypothetical protein
VLVRAEIISQQALPECELAHTLSTCRRLSAAATKNPSPVRRAGIDEYQSEASVLLPTSAVEQAASSRTLGLSREAPAMPVPSEPFAPRERHARAPRLHLSS